MAFDELARHRKSARWKPERRPKDASQETLIQTRSRLQRLSANVLQSSTFNLLMNIAVFCNAGAIGIDQSLRLSGGNSALLNVLEHVFILVFLFELCLHVLANGCQVLSNGWIFCDTCVVSAAVFVAWIGPLLQPVIGDVDSWSFLVVVTALRIARLARLVRAVRFIKMFSQLWLIVHGFMGSLQTIFYVLVVLFLVLFTYSAAAMELITLRYQNGTHPAEISSIVDEYFQDLGSTMLTLMQVTCMDGVAQIYRPLIEYDAVLTLYFISAVLVISVVFMNIITAVIVEAALEQSQNDKELRHQHEEEKKTELMDNLYLMFKSLDKDGSGALLLDELLGASSTDLELLSEFCGDMDITEVFNILDVSGEGSVDICEFCEGLYRAAMDGTPLELRRITCQVQRIENILVHLSKREHGPVARESCWSVSALDELPGEALLFEPANLLEDANLRAPPGRPGRLTAPGKPQSEFDGMSVSQAAPEDVGFGSTIAQSQWESRSCLTASIDRHCALLRRSQAALEELREHHRLALLDAQRLGADGRQVSRWCTNLTQGREAMTNNQDPTIMEVVTAARKELLRPVEGSEPNSPVPRESQASRCQPPSSDLSLHSSATKGSHAELQILPPSSDVSLHSSATKGPHAEPKTVQV